MPITSSAFALGTEVHGMRLVTESRTDSHGHEFSFSYAAHSGLNPETILRARTPWLNAEVDRLRAAVSARAKLDTRLSAVLLDAVAAGRLESEEVSGPLSRQARAEAANTALNRNFQKRLLMHHILLLASMGAADEGEGARDGIQGLVLRAIETAHGRRLTPGQAETTLKLDWVRTLVEFYPEFLAEPPNWVTAPEEVAA